MEFKEFKDIFIEEARNNNINIYEDKIEIFYKYMKYVLEWNEKINLTAIKNEKEFLVKHFIDSLTVSRYIENNKRIIDIGTGAGFPGMPLKIVNDSLNITLLDSINKKINVLKDISEKLNMKDIKLIHGRAEDIARDCNYREKFDFVTSRAVSNLTTLVEYMLPLLKVNGLAICMKGPNYNEEIDTCKNALNLLGGKIVKVDVFKISEDLERSIIVIKKLKQTPNKYPREKGKPLKEPLF